jgi:glutaredoxin 3
MTEKETIMYVVPDCPICEEVRQWLNEHDVAYDELDVANNFAALRKMFKLTRQKFVPVVVVGNKAIVRPSKEELSRLFA